MDHNNLDTLEEFSPEWFDASSKAWMQNKKKGKHCSYKYVCPKCKKGMILNAKLNQMFCTKKTCLNQSQEGTTPVSQTGAAPVSVIESS